MIRYCSRRPPDTELRARLRELANERRRFGYRRLFILLRREGEPSGINRIHRLYREEGLAVRKRRARRKAVGARVPIRVAAKPNARWSLDFVHDQFANGRRFRVLNIVDDVTKECLGRQDSGAKVFFAPKSLRAGGLWLPQLAREIAEATAFVLLVGEKGIGPWQAMEYYEALDRRVKEPELHAFTHGTSCPSLLRRTSPKCP